MDLILSGDLLCSTMLSTKKAPGHQQMNENKPCDHLRDTGKEGNSVAGRPSRQMVRDSPWGDKTWGGVMGFRLKDLHTLRWKRGKGERNIQARETDQQQWRTCSHELCNDQLCITQILNVVDSEDGRLWKTEGGLDIDPQMEESHRRFWKKEKPLKY